MHNHDGILSLGECSLIADVSIKLLEDSILATPPINIGPTAGLRLEIVRFLIASSEAAPVVKLAKNAFDLKMEMLQNFLDDASIKSGDVSHSESSDKHHSFLFGKCVELKHFIEEDIAKTKGNDMLQISDMESYIVEAVWQDDNSRLMLLLNQNNDSLDLTTASRLLNLSCRLDSVACAHVLLERVSRINEFDEAGLTPLHNAASMHSTKCIDLLLKLNARTDLKSKDENSLLPLEISLSCRRMQVDWSPKDPVQELLVLLRKRDLSSIKLLVAATDSIFEVAFIKALEGHIIELAALLLVAADKIIEPMHKLNAKRMRTIYEMVLEEAMKLYEKEQRAQSSSYHARYGLDMLQVNKERRKLYLLEIELLQIFGAVVSTDCKSPKVLPHLLQALQIGDESVSKFLLEAGADTSQTDAFGNSVLHMCLRMASVSQKLRLICLLLKHGASVCQQNLLGLTPVHVAAEMGNYHALQILLLQAPECVDIASKTKETPLFFAARNGFLDCTKLLMQYGANSQAINLRRQRAVDVANSQEIRLLILNPINQDFLNCAITSPKDNNHGILTTNEIDSNVQQSVVSNSNQNAEAVLCRYYMSSSGCARGLKCNFSHGESEPKPVPSLQDIAKPDVMNRKIFIGGLPFYVDSDYLREFFQAKFGPVTEATVITTKAGSLSKSRGFGFVIFKQKETAVHALQTNFVTIFNKKVEIKTCMPQCSSVSDPSLLEKENLPPWVLKFEKWLPSFIKRAMNRAENREGYPLSSLKADFRATCCMELDHMSLGFFKLSDFIRAFPEICKTKLQTAPNGLATHMVLLPLKSNRNREMNNFEFGCNESYETESMEVKKIVDFCSEYGEDHLNFDPWCLKEYDSGNGANKVGQNYSHLSDKKWDQHYTLVGNYCDVCLLRSGSLVLVPCHHKLCIMCFKAKIHMKCIICYKKVIGILNLEDNQYFYPTLEMVQIPNPANESAKEVIGSTSGDGYVKCQFRTACQGDKATISCLPCGHKIACTSCIPPSWFLGLKSCTTCGSAVERLHFLDK